MNQEMAIRLSHGPAKELVRLHTECSAWDRPEVRYMRRPRRDFGRTIPLRLHQPEGNEEFVLDFGKVHVHIHTEEDHIRIVLREPPGPPDAA